MDNLDAYLYQSELRLQMLEAPDRKLNDPVPAVTTLLRHWQDMVGGGAIVYVDRKYWCISGIVAGGHNIRVAITSMSDLAELFGAHHHMLSFDDKADMLARILRRQYV